ncbi:MAG: hypothetical protein HN368_05970, partial [Spirochaetales bacterium]|nr:hypothetical protein [Spirochaetales bacterium]
MDYIKPDTLEDALAAASGGNAEYIGGGTHRGRGVRYSPEILISLENLGLGGITENEKEWVIGSGVCFQDLCDFPGLPPAIAKAAEYTASRTLRNMKTVGGEVAEKSSRSCLLAVLAAMDAVVGFAETGSAVSLADYLIGSEP